MFIQKSIVIFVEIKVIKVILLLMLSGCINQDYLIEVEIQLKGIDGCKIEIYNITLDKLDIISLKQDIPLSHIQNKNRSK